MRTPALLRRSRRPWRIRLRSPVVHWSLVAALALVTWSTLRSEERRVHDLAARWGRTTRVVLVRGDQHAGDRVGADDVAFAEVPASFVPSNAATALPVGRRWRVDVGDGEVVVASRLAGGSRLAATVPDGWRALSVPLPPGALRLDAADEVDLLAVGADGASVTVVRGAIVLTADGESVAVAVPADRVGVVADAVLAATLTVALAGAG